MARGERTEPYLPQVLVPELSAQMETVKRVHREDLAAGYAGTFLPGALAQKYKRAEKELVWAVVVYSKNSDARTRHRGNSTLPFI